MYHREFVYWLQGFFELSEPTIKVLSQKQCRIILAHIALVERCDKTGELLFEKWLKSFLESQKGEVSQADVQKIRDTIAGIFIHVIDDSYEVPSEELNPIHNSYKAPDLAALKKEGAEVSFEFNSLTGVLPLEAEQSLASIKGVIGIGAGDHGEVLVFIKDQSTKASLPTMIEGKKVVVKVSGEVDLFNKPQALSKSAEKTLNAIVGVLGIGPLVSEDEILVFIQQKSVESRLPPTIEGFKIIPQVTQAFPDLSKPHYHPPAGGSGPHGDVLLRC